MTSINGNVFSVKVDAAQQARVGLDMYEIANRIPYAMARAVNKTAKPTGIKLISDQLSHTLNLRVRDIKKRIGLKKRASPKNLSAEISLTRGERGSRPNIALYKGVRQRKGGVAVTFRKGGKREFFETGWKTKAPNSGANIVITRYEKLTKPRTRYHGPRGGRYRNIYGPTIPGVFAGKPGMAKEAMNGLSGVLEKRMSEEVNYELIRTARRG